MGHKGSGAPRWKLGVQLAPQTACAAPARPLRGAVPTQHCLLVTASPRCPPLGHPSCTESWEGAHHAPPPPGAVKPDTRGQLAPHPR